MRSETRILRKSKYEYRKQLEFISMEFEFQLVQAAIEGLEQVDQNENENTTYGEDFEELYFTIVTEAEKLLRASNKKEKDESVEIKDHTSDQNVAQPQAMIKLPAMDIPILSGQYEEWASFYDMFVAVMHTNERLPVVSFWRSKGVHNMFNNNGDEL